MLVGILCILLSLSLPSCKCSSPLYSAILWYEERLSSGCDVKVLPNTITWCSNKLKGTSLPEGTECYSYVAGSDVWLCHHGRWNQHPEERLIEGRQRRDLRPAFENVYPNKTCSLLCSFEESTSALGFFPPTYLTCPGSVTLYPEDGYINVTHTWDDPIAVDGANRSTNVIQIEGPPSGSQFNASNSPGTSYTISYSTTDTSFITVVCSFTVTAEIPTCPPLVNLTNGLTSCTDENRRGSNCTFTCMEGYLLNGSSHATCQENGDWSFDYEPQCHIVVCDALEVNIPNANVSCEDDSRNFDSVCWLTCRNNFLLRNDAFESSHLSGLLQELNMRINASEIASQEALDARDAADAAAAELPEAIDNYQNAQTALTTATEELQTGLDELNNLLTEYNNTFEANRTAYANATAALNNGDANAAALLAVAEQLNNDLEMIINDVENTQEYVNNLTLIFTAAQNNFDATTESLNRTVITANLAEELAVEKAGLAVAAAEAQQKASLDYNEAVMYESTGNKVVPTFIRCLPNGTWHIPGDPYCEDTEMPEIKCTPVYTFYLGVGETSGVITWSLPEGTDNSGVVDIVTLSGPTPGSNLSEGQHRVYYQAVDPSGIGSEECLVLIDVLGTSCNDFALYVPDPNMNFTCDGFTAGSRCNLTCGFGYELQGSSEAICELLPGSSSPSADWIVPASSCEYQNCSIPDPPENGWIECIEGTGSSNSSNGNSTSGVECTVYCNDGYMLPYKTEDIYSCDEDGVWNPSSFPIECIERGEEQSAVYEFLIQYVNNSCNDNHVQNFMTLLDVILSGDMASYDVCSTGHVCELGLMEGVCNTSTGLVSVMFSVTVKCEAWADVMLCNLAQDRTSSVEMSLTSSLESSGISANYGNLVLTSHATNTSSCGEGRILTGQYCEMCGRGTYYLSFLDICYICGPQTYSGHPGRVLCTACNFGTSSVVFGATSADDCLAQCPAGSYSSNGVIPCLKCPIGTFSTGFGSTSCTQCPASTWTSSVGTGSVDECIGYDIYFNNDESDLVLTNLSANIIALSGVLWVKSINIPLVTLGTAFFDQPDNFVFQMEMGQTEQLIFNSWDNEPTDIELEANKWIMLGFTWDITRNDVTLYKNGEVGHIVTLPDLTDIPDIVVISVQSGTTISGFSLSYSVATEDDMNSAFIDCSARLPGTFYDMDNMADLHTQNMDFVPTSCQGANASQEVDNCGLNLCQNDGVCVQNSTGYTCNCTVEYGGPFCEELLVHGNWSEWMPRAACSRTCGMGFQELYRMCDNPPPSEYGDVCEGNSTEIVECNLANCTVCDQPPGDDVTCSLTDEVCSPACPQGYVLPPGQHGQTFKCGLTTNYEWTPLSRLPVCAVSQRPENYTLTLTFEFELPVPCSVKAEVEGLIRERALNFFCPKHHPTCVFFVSILNCAADGRRKRSEESSKLELIFTVPLNSDGDFNLTEYYSTLILTAPIEEVLLAINALQDTHEELISRLEDLTVTDSSGNQHRLIASSGTVQATTNCPVGQIPTLGVCVSCQEGTYQQDDICVYCDVGTYQHQEGQGSCIRCPTHKSTKNIGARSPTECVDVVFIPFDYTIIIIIVVSCLLAIIIITVSIWMARRFYRSAKDRKKYDMEADRTSLYTDFPDIAYNVYFKRRQVLGFDEHGFPIIGRAQIKNGSIKKSDLDYSDDERASPLPTKEPFAYPDTEGLEPPFDYDPYSLWTIEDMVPLDREVKFDFPKVKTAIRYRVPGRSHLAHAYPLQMFGYTDKIRGRTRKVLSVPLNISVRKKLPQLLYRPPETGTLTRRLSMDTGRGIDREIGVHPKLHLIEEDELSEYGHRRNVPPLKITGPYSKKKGGSPSKRSLMTAITSSISPRTWSNSSRSAKSAKASGRGQKPSKGAYNAPPSPRNAKSASMFSPRSTKSATPKPKRPSKSATHLSPRYIEPDQVSPRDAIMKIIAEKKRTTRTIDDDDGRPHPKPSRFMMPKDVSKVSLPPPPPKSMLKEHIKFAPKTAPEEDRRPATTIGRKSVTIREEDDNERPATAAPPGVSVAFPVQPTLSQWQNPNLLKHQRPVTDAKSARETIVAPYSARPKSSVDQPLPNEVKESYRPSLLDHGPMFAGAPPPYDTRKSATPRSELGSAMERRPYTPAAFHPKPVMHGNVKVQRTQNFVMFKPPTNLSFGEPSGSEQSVRFQAPPPFHNKVTPTNSPRDSNETPTRSRWESKRALKHVLMKGFDESDDNRSRKDSFFMTELPDDSSTPRGVNKRRASKISNKSSPPPSYLEAKDHIVIEDSMSMGEEEEE